MTEQEITVQLSEDPFDTKTIKVQVPHGVKLLSNEAYAPDALAIYGLTDAAIDKTRYIENKTNYTTRGKVSFISEDKTRALIDIESKHTAFCALTKEPDYIVNELQVGMEIDVKIKTSKTLWSVNSIHQSYSNQQKHQVGNPTWKNQASESYKSSFDALDGLYRPD